MTKFDKSGIERHIRKHHPGCPEFAVTYFAERVAERDWRNVTLGGAVGIVMQSFMRHEMTNYNQLLLEGMDRKVARRLVQKKIDLMLEQWRRKPDIPPEPSGGPSRT